MMPPRFGGEASGGHDAAAAIGARALLLTDIVDSTAVSSALGDAAVLALWAAHDRIARDLLPVWRGREIDKSDGMLLLFDAAADAAAYAIEYQQALAALPVPLQARAGLHLGPVLLRENSAADIGRGAKPLEVEGLAKPTAARIMSLAGGGQLLLSAEARDALGDGLPEGHQLLSHGHWAMKGLAAPLEVFELRRRGRATPPPTDTDKAHRVVRDGERWLPLSEIPNNLPHAATSFVGRERELDEIKDRLAGVRLITLLGMGGLGKTRLSLQVAAESRHLFPDGVWFVDLSPLRDPRLVPVEVAKVLGLREEPDRPLTQTLCVQLRRQRLLLVVDNCEHLLDAAAELVDTLLRAVPQLRIIASSREPLDVPGEQSYPIQPLPVPGRDDDLATLQRCTAVQLFLDRAQAHRPDFVLDEPGAAPVAELVARLEGIPLAIELAAARLRTLALAEINAGLARRFEILTGGSRRLQARQQTLRALVDWSYDLLDAGEQAMLQRLGTFAGGFDLAAAVQVCLPDGGSEAEAAVAARLASLAEKSLLMPRAGPDGPRWGMLEAIRDYARERLQEAGAMAESAARHCAHYFAVAKQARDGLKGAEQARWIECVETDLDNLRAATALALQGGTDPFVAVKMAVALQGFWILRGYIGEGRAVVDAALALPAVQAAPVAQAHALYVGAALATSQSDHAQALRMLQQCLALRRILGQPVEIAATLSTLSLTLLRSGDPAAAAAGEREALALFGAAGDSLGQAIGHLHLGLCAQALGDDAGARAELAQGLALARDLDSREIEAECELVLAQLDLEAGALAPAGAGLDRSLAICRDARDRRGEANALRWLGRLALAAGRPVQAHEYLAAALPALLRCEMRDELLACLEDRARLEGLSGDKRLALQAAAAVQAWRDRLALERPPREGPAWEGWLAATRAALPADAAEAAWHEGQRWKLDEALARLAGAKA